MMGFFVFEVVSRSFPADVSATWLCIYMLNHKAGLGGLGNEIMIWILMTAGRAGRIVFTCCFRCTGFATNTSMQSCQVRWRTILPFVQRRAQEG